MDAFARKHAWVPLVVTVVGVIVLGLLAWPYTVDDAYIVGRVARTIAHGGGYGMNVGERADAVTGPLWLLPGMIGTWLGTDAVFVAKATGLAMTALAACVVVRSAQARLASPLGAVTAAALVVCEPTLAIWGQAGLETGPATLAFSLALARACAVEARRSDGPLLAVLVGVVAWLRPELVPATFGVLLLAAPKLPAPFVSIAQALAAIATVAIFRTAMFGSPIPLSFFAKPGVVSLGGAYVLRAVAVHTSVLGLVLVGFSREKGLRYIAMVHLLVVALAGGDWMPGYRLLAPLVPLYALLAADGATQLFARGRRLFAVMLVAGALVVPCLDTVAELGPARDAGRRREHAGRALHGQLNRSGARVALVDVGFLVYRSVAHVIDLGGVADNRIGRLSGAYLDKMVRETDLRNRNPNYIVLHSMSEPEVRNGALLQFHGYGVEHRVARMAWVRESFRVQNVMAYSPGYYYIVLARREL